MPNSKVDSTGQVKEFDMPTGRHTPYEVMDMAQPSVESHTNPVYH